jgi:hypothetical protein
MNLLLSRDSNYRILWLQFLGLCAAVGKRTGFSASLSERIICGQSDASKIYLRRGVDPQFAQTDGAMFRVVLNKEIARLRCTPEGELLVLYLEYMDHSLWSDVAAHLGIKVAAVKSFLKGETNSEIVLDALNAAIAAQRKPVTPEPPITAAGEIAGAGHGLYSRVARATGTDSSHVRRVALGHRTSARISAALVEEAARIEKQILERRSSR